MSIRRAALVGVVVPLLGCGAMLSGTHQNMKLSVTPPGAEVAVYQWDGALVAGPASSPGSVSVHRPQHGQPYLVVASKEGRCPQYWMTTNGISAGGWGTILVFNGIIPLSIDESTGGLYKIHPDPVVAALPEDGTCPE